MRHPLELWIGLRYTRAKRRNHFISFISLVSMLGIAIGVMALIVVLSVMNGFERELRARILGMASHATISAFEGGLPGWPAVAEKARANPEIEAVAPYVQGEAMLRMSGALSGTLIRGVLPEAASAFPLDGFQIWVPRPAEVPYLVPAQLDNGGFFFQAIARLKPGVSLDEARDAMNVIAAGYRAAKPANVDAPSVIEVIPILEDAVGEQRRSYLMLFGAVACVLVRSGARAQAFAFAFAFAPAFFLFFGRFTRPASARTFRTPFRAESFSERAEMRTETKVLSSGTQSFLLCTFTLNLRGCTGGIAIKEAISSACVDGHDTSRGAAAANGAVGAGA